MPTGVVGRLLLACVITAAVPLAVPRALGRQAAADDGAALLRGLGFSAADITRIDRGESVGRSLPADPSDVALAVAITMRATPEFYLERFRDIAAFKKTAEVLQIGRIGATPTPADFAALTLDSDDVDDLAACRLDRCGVKLDRAGIEQLAGRRLDATAASAAMRAYLASYAADYLRSGDRALREYRDAKPARQVAADLQGLLRQAAPLQQRWPSLFAALGRFEGGTPPGLDGFLYWSKEKVGPRAVVSLTHVLISPPAGGSAVAATKQIYASHYSSASIGLTSLLTRASGAEPRLLVVYTNRTRVDVFGGLLGGLKRPIVRGRARDAAERMLQRLRERTERDFRAPRS